MRSNLDPFDQYADQEVEDAINKVMEGFSTNDDTVDTTADTKGAHGRSSSSSSDSSGRRRPSRRSGRVLSGSDLLLWERTCG